MIDFRASLLTLMLAVTLFINQPALAHGEEPRLEISVERINPGGVIEVRGVDFEYEEIFTLALIGEEDENPVGEMMADQNGSFLITVTLPDELKEGVYYFRAVTDDHEIRSPALTVQGSAAVTEDQGDQERREYEDGFAAPVPTFPPGVVPGAPPAATQVAAPDADRTPATNSTLVVMVSAVSLGAVALLVIVSRRRKL